MTTWSTRADITPGTISAIQAGLTVRLVMTARASLMTCRPEDPVDAVMADNVSSSASYPWRTRAGFAASIEQSNGLGGKSCRAGQLTRISSP